jgi:hypothetical protein
MDDDAFEAWKENLAEEMDEKPAGEETEQDKELANDAEESKEDPIQDTDTEEPIISDENQENGPESENKPERHINVDVTWDVPNPVIGDTAHLKANLIGYDGLNYAIQWQYSSDKKIWIDIPGENESQMDVVVTKENNMFHWRILVYIEEGQSN